MREDILPDAAAPQGGDGYALVDAIIAACKVKGVDPKSLHEAFEMQPSYWASILSGGRSIQSMQRKRLLSVAKFLGVPLATVMSLAELLQPEDFMVQQDSGDQLDLAYSKLKADPYWSTFAPSVASWDRMPRDAKVCMILMYERLFGEELVAKAKIHKIVRKQLQLTKGAAAAQETSDRATTAV